MSVPDQSAVTMLQDIREQHINIRLVKEVEKHPTIYNVNLPTYSCRNAINKAWEEVGAALDMPPAACREKWRCIRKVFMKSTKDKEIRLGTKRPYYLTDALQFLLPYAKYFPPRLITRSDYKSDKSQTEEDGITKEDMSSGEESDNFSIHSFDDVRPLPKRRRTSVPDQSAATMSRDISEQQLNVHFVKEVEKHPCIYNYKLLTYARKDANDKAWEEVGAALDMSPAACREKWRNIRAVFMRSSKLSHLGTKKPYYLSDALQFLLPFVRHKQPKQPKLITRSDYKSDKSQTEGDVITKEDKSSDEESDNFSIHSFDDVRPLPKRVCSDYDAYSPQLKAVRQAAEPAAPAADPVAVFLTSLQPELSDMNVTQFRMFKRRVLGLIDEIMTEVPSASTSNQAAAPLQSNSNVSVI